MTISGTVDYGFGSGLDVIISVPLSVLTISSGDGNYKFGLSARDDYVLPGDTFSYSAYALFDYHEMTIRIIQASYDMSREDCSKVVLVADKWMGDIGRSWLQFSMSGGVGI